MPTLKQELSPLSAETLKAETGQCKKFDACKKMMEDVLNGRTETTSFVCPKIEDFNCTHDDCNNGTNCQAE